MCKAVKKCSSVGGRKKKKSAWTDLDRVDFKKNFQRGNVQIEKSAWTGLGKNTKASSVASVFNFLQDWSPGGRRSVLHFDGLPLTRGAAVATPFAAAVSLTFSHVMNLKMLLQATRQPGYKIPGRVDDRAYRMTRVTKIGYEKLKDKT